MVILIECDNFLVQYTYTHTSAGTSTSSIHEASDPFWLCVCDSVCVGEDWWIRHEKGKSEETVKEEHCT